MWDLGTGEELWRTPGAKIAGLRFLGDATVAFSSALSTYQIVDAWSGSRIGGASPFRVYGAWGSNPGHAIVNYSREGDRVAIGGMDQVVVYEAATAEELGRLWRLSTGEELAQLGLFLEDDEWILSTPEFLFQSSPGAEDRMYFVQGLTSLPLESLYEQFHTPRLWERLVNGEDLSPLIPPNALRLPPEIELTLTDRYGEPLGSDPPEDGEIRVHLQARSTDSPVSEIRLYHNGKLVSARQRGPRRGIG